MQSNGTMQFVERLGVRCLESHKTDAVALRRPVIAQEACDALRAARAEIRDDEGNVHCLTRSAEA